MIDVQISDNKITVSGHAEHAPPGQDIVCAAVSVLVQTLAASINGLTGDKIEHDIRLGRAVIRYEDLTERSRLLVESFLVGVSGVAASYPECVKISREARPSVEVDKSNRKISIASENYGGKKK